MAGGVHGRGGMHGRWGACMAGGHAWQGGHAWHTYPHGRYYEIWSMSGQYASYWYAFLSFSYKWPKKVLRMPPTGSGSPLSIADSETNKKAF